MSNESDLQKALPIWIQILLMGCLQLYIVYWLFFEL